MPGWLGSGENSLPGSQMAAFLLCPHMCSDGGEREVEIEGERGRGRGRGRGGEREVEIEGERGRGRGRGRERERARLPLDSPP